MLSPLPPSINTLVMRFSLMMGATTSESLLEAHSQDDQSGRRFCQLRPSDVGRCRWRGCEHFSLHELDPSFRCMCLRSTQDHEALVKLWKGQSPGMNLFVHRVGRRLPPS